ncbi:MAG: UDP-N-acetylmuramoyl-L-alanyl-D-glutamate--2,6-diaminopimelate ligase [Parcubacteria group bacterium]
MERWQHSAILVLVFKESSALESILRFLKKLIPGPVFRFIQPFYHKALALTGAVWYGFPSRGMKIIAITGTKGKSTTVYMTARVFEACGKKVAAIGSLGFKILDREWPNNLHMTMPGRTKLQRFLRRAKDAGVKYVILEATSEGMAQGRLYGIPIDCAVLTNIHKEHIESHGGFEQYIEAKRYLFKKTKRIHIINTDNERKNDFRNIPAKETYFFGMENGGVNQKELNLKLKLEGDFNIYNALAALSIAKTYDLDMERAQEAIEDIDRVAGRMEYIEAGQNFDFIVDYAHTPESLEAVYKILKSKNSEFSKLICIFGSDGGGRDTWKRPIMGRIASQYCDEIILTSENPYDTDPNEIADEIEAGMEERKGLIVKRIIDRDGAMREAIKDAYKGDTIVITGKGTEDSIVVADGKKIPWLDSKEAKRAIQDAKV